MMRPSALSCITATVLSLVGFVADARGSVLDNNQVWQTCRSAAHSEQGARACTALLSNPDALSTEELVTVLLHRVDHRLAQVAPLLRDLMVIPPTLLPFGDRPRLLPDPDRDRLMSVIFNDLERAHRLDPLNLRIRSLWGILEARVVRFERAIEHFDAIIGMTPDAADAFVNRANTRWQALSFGRLPLPPDRRDWVQQIMQDHDHAVSLQPDNPIFRYFRASFRYSVNQTAELRDLVPDSELPALAAEAFAVTQALPRFAPSHLLWSFISRSPLNSEANLPQQSSEPTSVWLLGRDEAYRFYQGIFAAKVLRYRETTSEFIAHVATRRDLDRHRTSVLPRELWGIFPGPTPCFALVWVGQ